MPISKGNNGATAPVAEKPVEKPVESTKRMIDTVVETVQANGKDTRILRQGVYQATLQSPVLGLLPVTSDDDYLKRVEYVAEKVIKLIQG